MTVLPLVGGILVVYFLFSFVVVVAFFSPLNLGVFFMQMCAVGDCLVFFLMLVLNFVRLIMEA